MGFRLYFWPAQIGVNAAPQIGSALKPDSCRPRLRHIMPSDLATRQKKVNSTVQPASPAFSRELVSSLLVMSPHSVRIPSRDWAECSSPHARNAQISKNDRIVLA